MFTSSGMTGTEDAARATMFQPDQYVRVITSVLVDTLFATALPAVAASAVGPPAGTLLSCPGLSAATGRQASTCMQQKQLTLLC